MAEVKFDVKVDYQQVLQGFKAIEGELQRLKTLFAQAPAVLPEEFIKRAIETGKGLDLLKLKLEGMSEVSHSARVVLLNLSYVVRDLPWGFIGISNNVDMLVQRFIDLIRISGNVGGAFRLLVSHILGPSGLMLGLSLLTSVLTFYSLQSRRAKRETDDLEKAFGQFAETIREAHKSIDDISKTLERTKLEPEAVFRVDLEEVFKARTEVARVMGEVEERMGKIGERMMVWGGTMASTLGIIGALVAEKLGLRELEKLQKALQGLQAEYNRITQAINQVTGEQEKWLSLAEKFTQTLDIQSLGIKLTIKDLEALRYALQLKRDTLEITDKSVERYNNALQKLEEIIKSITGRTKEKQETLKSLDDTLKDIQKEFNLWVDALKVGAVNIDRAKEKFDELKRVLLSLEEVEEKEEAKIAIRKLRLAIERFEVELGEKERAKLRGEIENRIREIESEIEEDINRIKAPFVAIDVKLRLLKLRADEMSKEEFKRELEKLLGELSRLEIPVEATLDVREWIAKLRKEIEGLIQETDREIVESTVDMTRVMERGFARTFDFLVSEWERTWLRNKNVFTVFVASMVDEMARQFARVLAESIFSGGEEGKGRLKWWQFLLPIGMAFLSFLSKKMPTPEEGQEIKGISLGEGIGGQVNDLMAQRRVGIKPVVEMNLKIGELITTGKVQAIPRFSYTLQLQTQSLENLLIRVEKAIREQKSQINILLDRTSLARELEGEIVKLNKIKSL